MTVGTSPGGVASLCIPAYQAAEFIERTLGCAASQTLADVRILVSIDRSDDDTEAICRRRAAGDPRIEVHAQDSRLGWAGNVNFLLDRAAETEFAFLYFHDDLIEPEYCERLVGALRERPDAATAHCALGHFGARDTVIPARSYDGSSAERLLDFLTSDNKPSLLRTMFRTDRAGHLRLPTEAAGVWANQPFNIALVAAGPAIGVPDVLYRRWHKREGGLTDDWRGMSFEEILAGYRTNTAAALEAIDALVVTPGERDLLVWALMLHMTLRLRRAEELHDAGAVHPPEALHRRFAGLEPRHAPKGIPARLHEQCEREAQKVARRTRKLEKRIAAA